jgi:hypothetical protein
MLECYFVFSPHRRSDPRGLDRRTDRTLCRASCRAGLCSADGSKVAVEPLRKVALGEGEEIV